MAVCFFQKGRFFIVSIIKSISYVAQLPPTETNPRNSEGDFLRIRLGEREAILFVYTRFTGGSGDHASADLACLVSWDGGKSFSPPDLPTDGVLVRAADYNTDNVMSVSLWRFDNGDAGIFFLVKERDASISGYFRRYSSDEAIFGGAYTQIRVFPVRFPGYYVVNNCRIAKVGNKLFIPAADHRYKMFDYGPEIDGRGVAYVFVSGDDGFTWEEAPGNMVLPDSYSRSGLQEPGIIGLPSGGLYAYARTDLGAQYESFSPDGNYWTVPQRSCFTSPCSPMKIARNPYTGRYYSVWNPYGGAGAPQLQGIDTKNRDRDPGSSWSRTPLVIAQSDDCRSWSAPEIMDDDPMRGYCYPAVFFENENTMLVSYCSGCSAEDCVLCRTTIARVELG